MKFTRILLIFLGLIPLYTQAQLMKPQQKFTHADTLRGTLSPMRTCYDINYYHLDVKFDIANKFISGSNLFKFTATQDFNKLQFDLYANLKVEKVVYKGTELPFTRESAAVFVTFPKTISKDTKDEFTVFYSGNPTIAKNAPWDGGVVYTTDSLGRPFVATACQEIGASIWWPNKDQQADEVDSILISISVPKGLTDVSNGHLRKTTDLSNGYTRFDWFVGNPIDNYGVAVNIANYTHLSDSYMGENGKLPLDYWVLSYKANKAKKYFDANVKPMLKSFEHWFGPYPFYSDGYKLVETPYVGMEHQSAVGYGNEYHYGYLGKDLSSTGWGLKWDYIIVHESGHEWFGNNITSKDIADLWVHEGFTNYSESLYVESQFGKQAGLEYNYGLRERIDNDGPIVGPYGVNKEGSGDMYFKGAIVLNMIRAIINDDAKWRDILRGLNKTFYHKTVTYDDITWYISKQAGINLAPMFDQYLHYRSIPVLELMFTKDGQTSGRWIAEAPGFTMPVKIRIKGGEYKFVTPTTEFTPLNLPGLTKDNMEVDRFNYYIGLMVD